MSAILAPNNLADLLLQQDQATIYNAGLAIAQTLNLPVTSWQAGDPTRSLFFIEAAMLEALETVVVGFIQSGFLDYAQGEWLVIRAANDFGVTVPAATYAETTVTLTNSGGGTFVLEAGDLTFVNGTSGATYHNTTGGTLAGVGSTLDVDVVADVAGSEGNATVGEINALQTTLLGVSCTNAAAAVGTDQQDAATTVKQCRDFASSLSPNGAAAAYSYVATNGLLTKTQAVNRARVYDSSDSGDVTIYIAGQGGAVGGGDVTAVQNAINANCTPLCITPTVLNTNNVSVAITYSLWLYQSSTGQTTTQVETAIYAALTDFFASRPIGGDIIPPAATGALYHDMIEAVIAGVFPGTFRISVSVPSGDIALNNGDVAVLGAVTPNVYPIAGP